MVRPILKIILNKPMADREDLPVSLHPVKPLVSPEKAAEEWARFESLKAKLLTDENYQTIVGKRYIKRSGFRKIAVYLGSQIEFLSRSESIGMTVAFLGGL